MSDRAFLDTNILIYYVSSDPAKKTLARQIVLSNPDLVVSSQVIGEFVSVCKRKGIFPDQDTYRLAGEFMNLFTFVTIEKTTLEASFGISRKYGYSFYDSLILSTALENACSTLFTEDLQHGQQIEGSLKIVNPFH
ncbi:MAG: PIN domain-containing protein [Candidatus Wallbacteria bacterium]|nr:PIN domain-containing protein [Candidatus Wallbacteria bacterium]